MNGKRLYPLLFCTFDIFIMMPDKTWWNSPPLRLYTGLPLGQRRFIWLIKASRLPIPGPGSEGSWGIPYDRPDKFLLFQIFSAYFASSSHTVGWDDVSGMGVAFALTTAPSKSQPSTICIYAPLLLYLGISLSSKEEILTSTILIGLVWIRDETEACSLTFVLKS